MEVAARHGTGAIGYSLVAGAASKEGDEVCINYGMKDNGELLSSHGFVCREHARFDFTYVRIGVVTTCSRHTNCLLYTSPSPRDA